MAVKVSVVAIPVRVYERLQYNRVLNWLMWHSVLRKRRILGLDVRFAYDLPLEWRVWEYWYLPPPGVAKDGLVLDVGARDGDTALFYAEHGYRNLRLVEPDCAYHSSLLRNVAEIRRVYRAQIETRLKPFGLMDLDGAAFVKFDCEGCEGELDLDALPMPWAAEIHASADERDGSGVYANSRALGYRKSDVW